MDYNAASMHALWTRIEYRMCMRENSLNDRKTKL